MRYLCTAFAALALAGAVLAIAPPQGPPPSIVTSPTTKPPPTTGSGGGGPSGPPVTPEPSTLTIALVTVAAAGTARFLRRKN
jgi:hypothetical protein